MAFPITVLITAGISRIPSFCIFDILIGEKETVGKHKPTHFS